MVDLPAPFTPTQATLLAIEALTVISLIVGQTAPPGRRMGHAGAIITGTDALASSKVKSLEKAGAFIVPSPADIGSTTKKAISHI